MDRAFLSLAAGDARQTSSIPGVDRPGNRGVGQAGPLARPEMNLAASAANDRRQDTRQPPPTDAIRFNAGGNACPGIGTGDHDARHCRGAFCRSASRGDAHPSSERALPEIHGERTERVAPRSGLSALARVTRRCDALSLAPWRENAPHVSGAIDCQRYAMFAGFYAVS